jgi:hypothetical protein
MLSEQVAAFKPAAIAAYTAGVPTLVPAWGGARVRNWVSEDALRRTGLYNDDLAILGLSRTDTQAALRRWGTAWENWWKAR